jgi:putative Holliday junction resolvase
VTHILGIDHGSRRIGIAVADAETGMAFARPALRRRGGEPDIAALAALASAEGAQLVVMGLPLNMDGSEGRQAAAARRFGQRLGGVGLEVVYVDERLSSWEAGERMAEAGRRPPRDSGELDSAAARLILQQYLDMTKETE